MDCTAVVTVCISLIDTVRGAEKAVVVARGVGVVNGAEIAVGAWGVVHSTKPHLSKSNPFLFVTYTWLADVNASVAKYGALLVF